MKTNSTFAFLFFLAFFYLGLSIAYTQTDKVPFDTKEFTLSGTGSFEGEVSGASISITGTSGNKVTVNYFLKKDGKYFSASASEVKEFLEDYTIEISQTGNRISLTAKQKSSGNWSWRNRPTLSFEISAPKNFNTTIRTSGRAVSLNELNGRQELASSGGSITIKNSQGEINSQSSGGSFNLSYFEGKLDARSSGGSIRVSEFKGDISAQSSGGGINLEGISGSINASSSGGSIKANLVSISKDLIFKSSGGSIAVTVPSNLAFDIDLRGGSLNSSLQNFQGTTTKNQISGKVNGGGPFISMQSSGGSIRIENGN